MRLLRILGSLVVVFTTVMLGAVVGVWVSGMASTCQGQQCLGPAYTGLFFGALAGCIVGLIIVTGSFTHRRNRVGPV